MALRSFLKQMGTERRKYISAIIWIIQSTQQEKKFLYIFFRKEKKIIDILERGFMNCPISE